MWLSALLLSCRSGPDEVEVDVATCDGAVALTVPTPGWAEVAPILRDHCVSCHTADGIAGIPFDTYDAAARWSGAIASATADRRMPPYPGRNCDSCRTYVDAAWLDDADVATLGAWALADAPAGDDPPSGRLGASALAHLGDEASAVVTLPEPYTPDAALADDHRCFVVDPEVGADTYLTAVEVLPDQVQEVHHVLVFATADAAGDATVRALDAEAPGPGYPCVGGPGLGDAPLLTAWAPGTGRVDYPAGTGVLLPAGRLAVVQIHYNTANGVTPDRTAIAVKGSPTVDRPARFVSVNAYDELVLPPGQPAVEIVHREVVSGSAATVWGAAGHMHGLGRALSVRTDRGTCALDIPEWDFHWQRLYLFEEPYESSGGEEVELRCTYDTTSIDSEVRWGEGTDDEMCLAYLYVTGG